MTDRELLELVAVWREDIDSEPFAHEDQLDAAVAAAVPVTPSGGAGCSLLLAAGAVGLLLVIVVVSQIVMAVTS